MVKKHNSGQGNTHLNKFGRQAAGKYSRKQIDILICRSTSLPRIATNTPFVIHILIQKRVQFFYLHVRLEFSKLINGNFKTVKVLMNPGFADFLSGGVFFFCHGVTFTFNVVKA